MAVKTKDMNDISEFLANSKHKNIEIIYNSIENINKICDKESQELRLLRKLLFMFSDKREYIKQEAVRILLSQDNLETVLMNSNDCGYSMIFEYCKEFIYNTNLDIIKKNNLTNNSTTTSSINYIRHTIDIILVSKCVSIMISLFAVFSIIVFSKIFFLFILLLSSGVYIFISEILSIFKKKFILKEDLIKEKYDEYFRLQYKLSLISMYNASLSASLNDLFQDIKKNKIIVNNEYLTTIHLKYILTVSLHSNNLNKMLNICELTPWYLFDLFKNDINCFVRCLMHLIPIKHKMMLIFLWTPLALFMIIIYSEFNSILFFKKVINMFHL